jgi:hypothetical protein
MPRDMRRMSALRAPKTGKAENFRFNAKIKTPMRAEPTVKFLLVRKRRQ